MYDNLVKNYFKNIADVFINICSSCGGLFNKKSINKYTVEKLLDKDIDLFKNFIQEYCKFFNGNEVDLVFCFTCKASILKSQVQ